MFKFLAVLFFAVSAFALEYTHPQALINSAFSVSSVWSYMGSAIKNPSVPGEKYEKIGLKGKLDINDAENVRLRVLYSSVSNGSVFNYVIKDVGAASVGLEDSLYEFTTDADGNYIVDIPILPFNYIWVQTQAGTEGSSKAKWDEMEYFFLAE